MKNTQLVRPTKKQKILLAFIDTFIKQHGYSPSYREIMRALEYNSVATVALHVNSLITRGHLVKRGRLARSLEVVDQSAMDTKLLSNEIKPTEEKWLIEKVEHFFREVESTRIVDGKRSDELYVLVGALKVLGLDGAYQSYLPRLTRIKDLAK